MMNADGTGVTGQPDDQQIITPNERDSYITRLTNHFNGNRELAIRFDDASYNRSSGKLMLYRRVLQSLLQQRNQQMQQQQQQQQQQSMMNPQGQQQQQSMMNPQGQQQQQSMMNPQGQQQQQQQPMMNQQGQQQQQQPMMTQQGQQQQMYMQPQQTQMVGMPQQPPPQPPYTMQVPTSSSSIGQQTSMMNIKQEPQVPISNIPLRPPTQNIPMQQQQIKQELMAAPIQQQQQLGLQVQQMRQQQQQQQQQPLPPPPPQYMQQQQQQQQQQLQQPPQVLPPQPTAAPQQRSSLVQHLQQFRQQNHLNQQQESPNVSQPQQQPQPSNPSVLPQSSSMNSGGPSSSTSTPTTSSGSTDEILQHILTSPNPPKQPSTVSQNAAQARLRTINRNARNQSVTTAQTIQQQPSPLTPGSDPMMAGGGIPSPHSHPGMMQQQQAPIGPPGQNPLSRYMMAQSPQGGVYRPQMSPMNMMNYAGSPTTMIDDEMHFLFKFFAERIHYLNRIIARCQQEGQHDKVAKYRQLHDQMSVFVRNPIPEHLMAARRLKEHVDRMLGSVMMQPMTDMSTMIPPNANGARLVTNGIFDQCQRAIVDYLGKDSALKYNVAKRFLEPLSEVLNGVAHKTMRLDTDSKQVVEPYSSSNNNHSLTSLNNIIESEFAHLSMNTFSYELKPMYDKIATISSSVKNRDLPVRDYELTCRFVEINMPIVPPLKMKLTIKYPNEPPEILSLTSTTLNMTPIKLENSDGHTFFETISRNFVYFLFKLPSQHTVTDILDIWRTAIRNASFSQNES